MPGPDDIDETPEERARRIALEQLAGVESELGRIRVPVPGAPPDESVRTVDLGDEPIRISSPETSAQQSPFPPGRERPVRGGPVREVPLDAAGEREAAEARRIGDAYRASIPPPVDPREVGARPTGIPGGRQGWVYPPRPDGTPPPPMPERTLEGADAVAPEAPPERRRQILAQIERMRSEQGLPPMFPPAAAPPATQPAAPGAPPTDPSGEEPEIAAEPAPEAADFEASIPAGPGMGRALGDPRAPAPAELAEAPAGSAGPKSRRDELMELLAARLQQRPPEHDYTGVDVADAIATPFRALGRGLMAAAGRSPGQSRSWGDEARARDRASDQAAQQRGDHALQQMIALRRLEGDGEERASRARREELQQMLAERRLGLEDRRASAYERSARSLDEQRAAQTDLRRREMAQEEELDDPNSDLARHERAAWQTALATYPDAARARYLRNLQAEGIDPSLRNLTARALREMASHMDEGFRDTLQRQRVPRAGGGMAVGGGALATPPEGWQGTEEQWRALPLRLRQQQVASLGGRRQGGAQQARANELAVRTEAANDAVRALTEAMPPEGQDVPGFGPVDSLRGRTPFLQSTEGIRMRTLAENAVRRYLRLESGASISDQEMRTEMELRGMGTGATEQQFRQGARDLQRDLQTRLRVQGRGEQPAAARRPAEQPPADDFVRVRRPGGERGRIPRSQLAAALAAGWEEL